MNSNETIDERPLATSTKLRFVANKCSSAAKESAARSGIKLSTSTPRDGSSVKEKALVPREKVNPSQQLASSSTETLATNRASTTDQSSATPMLSKEGKLLVDGDNDDKSAGSLEGRVFHGIRTDVVQDWSRHHQHSMRQSPESDVAPAMEVSSSLGDPNKRQQKENIRYHMSPTKGWPQRSPINQDHDQDHDESSFYLFTHSFDTLSETGNYLREMGQQQDGHDYVSPYKVTREIHQSRHHVNPPKKIGLAIRGSNDSESSVGDISPIRFVQHSKRDSPSIPRRDDCKRSCQHREMTPKVAYRVSLSSPKPSVLQYTTMPHMQASNSRRDRRFGGSLDTPGGHTSNPFFVLRSVNKAFVGCSYRLPCLSETDVCQINISRYSNIHHYHERKGTPDEDEIVIATRRVEVAIYAFGGWVESHAVSASKENASSVEAKSVTIKSHRKTQSREFYEERFHQRYFVTSNQISWEVEENPPVEPTSIINVSNQSDSTGEGNYDVNRGPHVIHEQFLHQQDESTPVGDRSPNSTCSVIPADNQQKMKYRCKLCGQLKQNHNCPYQQSLQRSIAVMVYPAVNAFTASEPGILTKNLSKMNNFVSYDSDKSSHDTGSGYYAISEFAPTSSSQQQQLQQNEQQHIQQQQQQQRSLMRQPITHVTPETKTRGACAVHSPESSLSTQSHDASPSHHHPINNDLLLVDEPRPHHAPSSTGCGHIKDYPQYKKSNSIDGTLNPQPPTIVRKRSHVQLSGTNIGGEIGVNRTCTGHRPSSRSSTSSFKPSLTLRPEQYRTVTQKAKGEQKLEESRAFQYPHVPLTFTERKRLSDTLFLLSKEVPTVTRDVADLLRTAREKQEWDLAVAQILTQVIVGIHCREGDHRLDGLQRYLLGIGISC